MAMAPEEFLRIKQMAQEETLKSIDSTLKRIADILEKKCNPDMEKVELSCREALGKPLNLRWQQEETEEERESRCKNE